MEIVNLKSLVVNPDPKVILITVDACFVFIIDKVADKLELFGLILSIILFLIWINFLGVSFQRRLLSDYFELICFMYISGALSVSQFIWWQLAYTIITLTGV